MILQFEEKDARQLVEILTISSPRFGYLGMEQYLFVIKIINQMQNQIEQQTNGQFFQCEACYDAEMG